MNFGPMYILGKGNKMTIDTLNAIIYRNLIGKFENDCKLVFFYKKMYLCLINK